MLLCYEQERMEISTVKKMQKEALKESRVDFVRLGAALFFMVAVLSYSFLSTGGIPNNMFLAIAALFGAYMAMIIGANDVANNVEPAVGSKALTMGGVIAAIFLFSIKKTMVYKEDKIKASTKWVPVFVAIMSWGFVTYLTLKGLKKIWPNIVEILVFLPDTKKLSFLIT